MKTTLQTLQSKICYSKDLWRMYSLNLYKRQFLSQVLTSKMQNQGFRLLPLISVYILTIIKGAISNLASYQRKKL